MPEQSTYPVCLLTPAELATYVALAGLADVNGRVRNVKAEVIMARVLKQGGTTRAALRKLVVRLERRPPGVRLLQTRDIRGTDEERYRMRRLLADAPQLRPFLPPMVLRALGVCR